jgi:hypothetical protein
MWCTTLRYQSKRSEPAEHIAMMKTLAAKPPTVRISGLHVVMVRQSWSVNRKRFYRPVLTRRVASPTTPAQTASLGACTAASAGADQSSLVDGLYG